MEALGRAITLEGWPWEAIGSPGTMAAVPLEHLEGHRLQPVLRLVPPEHRVLSASTTSDAESTRAASLGPMNRASVCGPSPFFTRCLDISAFCFRGPTCAFTKL